MKTILAIIFFLVMVSLYIVLYLMNKRTPLPEGCENLKADCEGCHDYSCTNNPAHYRKKETDQ